MVISKHFSLNTFNVIQLLFLDLNCNLIVYFEAILLRTSKIIDILKKMAVMTKNVTNQIFQTLVYYLISILGLSIVGKKSGPGVYISEVVKGGAADSDGRLVQGDQILFVNGHDLTDSSQEEAAPILKMAQGRIVMVVRRLKVGNRRQQSTAR